jgi:hypothetical protein
MHLMNEEVLYTDFYIVYISDFGLTLMNEVLYTDHAFFVTLLKDYVIFCIKSCILID